MVVNNGVESMTFFASKTLSYKSLALSDDKAKQFS